MGMNDGFYGVNDSMIGKRIPRGIKRNRKHSTWARDVERLADAVCALLIIAGIWLIIAVLAFYGGAAVEEPAPYSMCEETGEVL